MTKLSNEADFYRFMEVNGPPSLGGKRNYLSWLRYVNELYSPNFDSLTIDDVELIFQELRRTQNIREKYTSNSAVSDIKSALNKYLAYISRNAHDSDEISDITSVLNGIDTTTKTEIETRLGQGKYRKDLINIWRRCAVTEFDRVDLLIASHIKPWKLSNKAERIDPYNGLLLSPNLDKLFDRGYISFENNGSILISSLLGENDLKLLGVSTSMKLYKVEQACIPYLDLHRSEILV